MRTAQEPPWTICPGRFLSVRVLCTSEMKTAAAGKRIGCAGVPIPARKGDCPCSAQILRTPREGALILVSSGRPPWVLPRQGYQIPAAACGAGPPGHFPRIPGLSPLSRAACGATGSAPRDPLHPPDDGQETRAAFPRRPAPDAPLRASVRGPARQAGPRGWPAA